MLLFGFSKSDFVSWLQGHKPDESVGNANNCRFCPIATFLATRMECGVEVWSDTAELTFDDGTEITAELPDWAITFVHAVDKDCGISQPPVLAAHALNIAHTIQEAA